MWETSKWQKLHTVRLTNPWKHNSFYRKHNNTAEKHFTTQIDKIAQTQNFRKVSISQAGKGRYRLFCLSKSKSLNEGSVTTCNRCTQTHLLRLRTSRPISDENDKDSGHLTFQICCVFWNVVLSVLLIYELLISVLFFVFIICFLKCCILHLGPIFVTQQTQFSETCLKSNWNHPFV